MVQISSSDSLQVEVCLNYQTPSWSFLQDLFKDDGLPEVARFRALYEDQAILAEQIAGLQCSLPCP